MRTLILIACSAVLSAALVGAAGAVEPNAGALSVDRGKGVITLDIRGSVLGRLASGSLRVTDLTPRDRYGAIVVGRKLAPERLGPKTVVYRGQGLRFRMLGGAYRIVVRGSGISLSAVGRGIVLLEAERTLLEEDAGAYSIDGVDCGIEPESCTPLPDDPERFILGPGEGPRTMLP
jgi:hypothetical protein